jgi:hypothetical protein
MMSSSNGPGNSLLRVLALLIFGGITIVVLAAVTAVLIVAVPEWLPFPEPEEAEPAAFSQATPRPTFTITSVLSPTFTPIPTTSPSSTATDTPVPTETPLPSATPTATVATAPQPVSQPLPTDTPVPAPPSVDFVVTYTHMRTNDENSQGGKVANNCGGDHTIYVLILDGESRPINNVIVGDTYKNVRSVSGVNGAGRLAIQLWSNTMALEVQGHIDGTPYTSEQTAPLSTRDEDIPAEWLFEGGYCESVANCQLRQQTNGLCRGHYSYDVTFQRTW